MTGLPCMNCREHVEAGKARLFAEVFLCETCYASAVHFHGRLLAELQRLMTVAKEAIRVSLIEGRFFFPEATGASGAPSKQQVLELLMSMEEQRKQKESLRCTETHACQTQVPPSTASTSPSAPTPVAQDGESLRMEEPLG